MEGHPVAVAMAETETNYMKIMGLGCRYALSGLESGGSIAGHLHGH